MTVDVSFGGALEPSAEVIDYPCMLDLPAPRLRAYACETQLARAIAPTFERRETNIPAGQPDALTPAFVEDEQKQRQWDAFSENVALRPGSLADVTTKIAEFTMPHAIAAAKIDRSD